jgi:hypothetical protein
MVALTFGPGTRSTSALDMIWGLGGFLGLRACCFVRLTLRAAALPTTPKCAI